MTAYWTHTYLNTISTFSHQGSGTHPHHIWVTHIHTTKLLCWLRQQIRLNSLGGENAVSFLQVLQRAPTAAQSLFTVGGFSCALFSLGNSTLVLLFGPPSYLVKNPVSKGSETKKNLKSLEGRERVKAACCLCSLTYCKVLVITKVTYAQRLRNIAPSVPLYSHRLTARYPVSSPRRGCRWGARVPPSQQGVSRKFAAMPEVSLRTAGGGGEEEKA